VSDRIILESRIPLPSLDEQRRIAGILNQTDALREKRQLALKRLDELTQAIFTEMFGDVDANPKGFNVLSLHKLYRRVTDGTHQPPQWAESGIPFIFVSKIRNRVISLETEKFISNDIWSAERPVTESRDGFRPLRAGANTARKAA
jgi:type I restriction enzyme S subunit